MVRNVPTVATAPTALCVDRTRAIIKVSSSFTFQRWKENVQCETGIVSADWQGKITRGPGLLKQGCQQPSQPSLDAKAGRG